MIWSFVSPWIARRFVDAKHGHDDYDNCVFEATQPVHSYREKMIGAFAQFCGTRGIPSGATDVESRKILWQNALTARNSESQ